MIDRIRVSDDWYFETGPGILANLERLLAEGKSIGKYEQGMPDNSVDGLTWDAFGAWDNDVDMLYIRANYKDKSWAMRSKPGLLWPRMVDRCFGMDGNDRQIVMDMSDRLYEVIEDELK